MIEINRPITFCQLLDECERIEVPLIQRDYAQGRETAKEVRDHFLTALHTTLTGVPEDSVRPLNLDFVYGTMESRELRTFLPLDGQQRLTTLFLLHWYLAWRDGQLLKFQSIVRDGRRSRFTYTVRPSSTEFFDQLVLYIPETLPDDVPTIRNLLVDQHWFFLHWRLDPTIQSSLVMLEAIHGLFRPTRNLFASLIDNEHPAITFQLLPLEHFGLTDDLYIKMNARGKPLTPFETFKARFEEVLLELYPTEKRNLRDDVVVSVAKFFEIQIDTQWTNFLWSYKNKKTDTFDDAAMNLLVALARVSLDPASPRFDDDTALLRERQVGATFSLFHEHGWLTREFASSLINLLEVWSRGGGKLSPVVPEGSYFDETGFFEKAIQEPSTRTLDYTQLVQFAAFVFYLRHHEGDVESTSLNEWMRVVRNLAANSDIERSEEYGRCLAGLLKLLPFSNQILRHFSAADVGLIGFSPQQVREEALKAKLILTNSGWRTRIDEAEAHGYFSGQIDFLLDFSGVVAAAEKMPVNDWEVAEHAQLQTAFDRYLKKVKITFTSSGLVSPYPADDYLWKRALLTLGNYLVPIGLNYSFVTDPLSSKYSWKRFLRDGLSGKREYLKTLWERLDANAALEPQLNLIISSASGLEPWRAAIVKHPNVIAYCGQQEIRFSSDEIYLMHKASMRGYHAELYSYVLYLELNTRHDLASLSVKSYEPVYMTESEPHVLLELNRSGHRVRFAVESRKGQFCIYTSLAELQELPEVESALCAQGLFSAEANNLNRWVSREEIRQVLGELDKNLANLPA